MRSLFIECWDRKLCVSITWASGCLPCFPSKVWRPFQRVSEAGQRPWRWEQCFYKISKNLPWPILLLLLLLFLFGLQTILSIVLKSIVFKSHNHRSKIWSLDRYACNQSAFILLLHRLIGVSVLWWLCSVVSVSQWSMSSTLGKMPHYRALLGLKCAITEPW